MTDSTNPSQVPPGAQPRRGFMTSLMAIVAGGIAGLVPLASGVLFFLDPILRKKGGSSGSGDGFLRAATVQDLPADGSPVRFVLRADIKDAWTIYRDRVLGSVYLRQINGQVIAFNDTCPHLGCKVDYQPADGQFFCPCHQSAFDLEGKRKNPTPPRNMDDLQVEVRDGTVYVKYQNFRTATDKKEAIE